MRNEIFENLNGCDPRLPLVRYPRLSADTHDHLVVLHAVDKVSQRIRENFSICVNLLEHITSHECYRGQKVAFTHHQHYLKKVWRDSHENVDLPKQIEIQRSHPIIVCDTREEIHEDELAITLSSIARLLVDRCLLFRTTFDDDDRWCPTTSDS